MFWIAISILTSIYQEWLGPIAWGLLVMSVAMILWTWDVHTRIRGAWRAFWSKPKESEKTLKESTKAPESNRKSPRIDPVRYGQSDDQLLYGLIIANVGEPAYEVSIPDVSLGALSLTFECNLPRLIKDDGNKFCAAWIKRGPHDETGGSMLFGEMVRLDVEAIDFPVRFKDRENRWYQTVCRMERDVTIAGGLRVGYVRQETIKPPG